MTFLRFSYIYILKVYLPTKFHINWSTINNVGQVEHLVAFLTFGEIRLLKV